MSIFQKSGDWHSLRTESPVTLFLIIINAVMLVAVLVTGGFLRSDIVEWGVVSNSRIFDDDEYYRLFTAAFLHGSMMHFLSNIVIGLLALSSAAERLIGSAKFAILYFGSLLISSFIVALLSEIDTLGASGAIFGILGSLLWMTIYRKDMMSERDATSVRALIAVNILFTFFSPGISIPGHIGGIVSGFLLSYLLIRRNVFKVLH